MRALILGGGGQVGLELQRTRPDDVESVALDHAALDITDSAVLAHTIEQIRPAVVINAAAYTQVDRAESEADRAFQVNAAGPAYLAKAVRAAGVRLVHVSTDFVFGGQQPRPLRPDAPTGPLTVYGRSKLAGEIAIGESAAEVAVIVRTAWVYSIFGANFVKTMLRLMAAREEISVVADQVGTPTWARGLAQALWDFARHPEITGSYHWTDSGVASWYDFAVAIQEEGLARRLLDREIAIRPIRSDEYPTAARRPAYSVLDVSSSVQAIGRRPRHWRQNLRTMLDEFAKT